MTPIAIAFLILALVIIWGGLIASTVFLMRRPEVAEYPAGGEDGQFERIE
ncbi:methionine/alanine import family NSS transporter small subunit [Leucobacter chromiireducens]|nr:methionine/alanine import family NSS transporter small subunit [Leucobacter chromiireducens]